MADEVKETETLTLDVKLTPQDIESKIQAAMHSLVSHFKEQADSLTFEGVRRLLEKDLGLETYALDVHKRYIKQCLVKCLDGADGDNASKNTKETGMRDAGGVETANTLDLDHLKDVKESYSEDEEKMEDSPVMGRPTGKNMKIESEEIKGNEKKEVPSESTIKKAIRKRLPYIKANSEKVTMSGLRRLLEDDLGLDKFTLDTCKKFISQQIEEMINFSEVSKSATKAKKSSVSKASKKVSRDGDSDSVENVSSEEENVKVKPKKKNVPKGKSPNSDDLKKRKRPQKETVSSKKSKPPQKVSEDNSDEENSGNVSEEGQSQSSTEKPVKKKEVSTPVYGKRVEHLKSVIKLCGMSVPPSVYKKVKQTSENKREGKLIKELEEILSREGLSENPSEKEIKEIRKKKERAKELEGIDVSNIVSSTRRRSTTSFVAPPKPKAPVESDDDESDSNSEDDNDDEEDAQDDVEDAQDGGDGHDSHSEEFDEDNDEEESD